MKRMFLKGTEDQIDRWKQNTWQEYASQSVAKEGGDWRRLRFLINYLGAMRVTLSDPNEILYSGYDLNKAVEAYDTAEGGK